jgi:hypothetical protein
MAPDEFDGISQRHPKNEALSEMNHEMPASVKLHHGASR